MDLTGIISAGEQMIWNSDTGRIQIKVVTTLPFFFP